MADAAAVEQRPAAARTRPLDVSRLRVVFLHGDARERGRQLGEHLRSEADVARRQLGFWLAFPFLVARNRLPHLPPAAWRNVARLIDGLLVRPIARQQSQAVQDGARGMAEAFGALDDPAGDAVPRLVRAHSIYDAINTLGALPLGNKAPASRLGCSSLVALPRTTASGELIHGRNFDLPPFGDDEDPLLCVHRPDDGLAHVSLHHGGGWTPGITATNEAGLTVGVHQNYTHNVSTARRPVVGVAQELIETCASVTDAVELLHQRPTAAGWTFIVSDAKSGRAVALEMDADGAAALYPPGAFLSVANCYRTTKDVHEYAFTGALREHNWCRLARLNQMAREHAGAHAPETVAAALGDHRDAYDVERQRPYGNVVSALHNLDAVVVSPGSDALYVAVGKAPRNCADGYVGLSLSALFAGRVVSLPPLSSPLPPGPFRASLERASDAARAHFHDDDREGALSHLEEASALAPDEPMHRLMRGTLLLANERPAEAVEALEGLVDEESSPYRRGLSALMLGRARDVRGHRHEAKRWYTRVPELCGDVDQNLCAQAARARERGFSSRAARALVADLIFGDVPA